MKLAIVNILLLYLTLLAKNMQFDVAVVLLLRFLSKRESHWPAIQNTGQHVVTKSYAISEARLYHEFQVNEYHCHRECQQDELHHLNFLFILDVDKELQNIMPQSDPHVTIYCLSSHISMPVCAQRHLLLHSNWQPSHA